KVIPMTGWQRSYVWQDTGLTFVPPSPNIRSPRSALFYPGIGMFEATNVSVGRGTRLPFEQFGAPWMKGELMAEKLGALQLPGVTVSSTTFTPSSDLYAGQSCSGVRLRVTDPYALRSVDIFVQAAVLLRDLSGTDFVPRWDEVARVTGSKDFEAMYKTGKSPHEILAVFKQSDDQFTKDRQPYLLY
ncbi:MAG TPA: exo-beta-N-acetylmuramidase NamZ domain-containing protein, partial [Elusimicrobiota bacterium]|nr:exo-beta-N-acetylmuramidase NamZ domain-containing protein [Elusimicrobiota bacterium]